MMLAFFGYTVARQLINKKVIFSFFYFGFALFILYGASNIFLENVINEQIARTMVVSLTLNLMMIYSIVQYIYMQNDIPKVLKITEFGIFSTSLLVVLLSLRTLISARLGRNTVMNSNMLAILCVFGVVLCMYLRKIDKLPKKAYWFRLAFYALAILLTGSRKGLLMLLIAFMLVKFISNGTRKLFRNLLFSIAAVIIAYTIIMKVEVFYNIIGVRMENFIQILTEGSTEENSINDRMSMMEMGLSYFKKKPWTGYGFDCFKMVSGHNGGGKVNAGNVGYYSHNNYVELLFGGGIIGFVLYYIPIAYLLIKLFVKKKSNPCILYLLAFFIAKLAFECVYVSYYERVDTYVVSIILGCTLLASVKKKDENTTPAKDLSFNLTI